MSASDGAMRVHAGERRSPSAAAAWPRWRWPSSPEPVSAEDARTAFRPCIDPNNLPFANDKGEGFENRIAELFAKQLGLPVQSYSFPQRMNFIRNTLRYKLPGEDFRCDIVMSVPADVRPGVGDQAVLPLDVRARLSARARASTRSKSGADLFALAAERARQAAHRHLRPLARLDLARAGTGWKRRRSPIRCMSPDPEQYPGEIIEKDLAQGKIDAAIVWGPIAGYYAKRVRNVELVVVPLKSEPGVKFDYEIAMGVRYGEREWKATVDKLHRRQPGRDHGDPARVRRSAASTRKASRSTRRRTARHANARAGAPMWLIACCASASHCAHANDFPTRARVDFVLSCMRDSKAPPQESMYKCSCAIDVIADKVALQRLGRPVDDLQRHHDRRRAWRRHAGHEGRPQADRVVQELQASAKKQCFLTE